MNGTRKQSQSCSGTSTLEAKRGRHHDDGHAASHARDTLVDPAVQRLEAVPIDVVCEYCKFYCPACRTTLVATRFRVAVICPIIQVPHCIRVFFYFV